MCARASHFSKTHDQRVLEVTKHLLDWYVEPWRMNSAKTSKLPYSNDPDFQNSIKEWLPGFPIGRVARPSKSDADLDDICKHQRIESCEIASTPQTWLHCLPVGGVETNIAADEGRDSDGYESDVSTQSAIQRREFNAQYLTGHWTWNGVFTENGFDSEIPNPIKKRTAQISEGYHFPELWHTRDETAPVEGEYYYEVEKTLNDLNYNFDQRNRKIQYDITKCQQHLP